MNSASVRQWRGRPQRRKPGWRRGPARLTGAVKRWISSLRPAHLSPIVCAAGGLALAAVGAAGTLLIGYAAPDSALARALPIADLANIRANEHLAGAHPSPHDLVEAEKESRRALALSPLDSSAWTRLAYIDALRRPPLGPQGLDALRKSYVVAPLGPDISRWRVRFALERWAALPADLQAKVEAEIDPLWWRDRDYVEGLPDQVADPAGHLAVRLEILKLHARDVMDRAKAG
jgi:hypothetical protein